MKSLADYNLEQSSASGIDNIVWSKRHPADPDKPRNKKKKGTSPTNIIPNSGIKKTNKIFVVKDSKKTKKKNHDKKFLNSSATNGLIQQDFKRPGR